MAEATSHHTADELTAAMAAMAPRNALTDKPYQGGNVQRLWEAAMMLGVDPEGPWGGFRQWLQLGRVVRKGQHGTPILAVFSVPAGKGEAEQEDRNGKPRRSKVKGEVVFHLAQTEELAR